MALYTRSSFGNVRILCDQKAFQNRNGGQFCSEENIINALHTETDQIVWAVAWGCLRSGYVGSERMRTARRPNKRRVNLGHSSVWSMMQGTPLAA